MCKAMVAEAAIDEYDDVAIKNYYRIERAKGRSHEEVMQWIWKNGRDNSRTPMQWSDEENAGFTTGTPWIGVNENYKQINVKKQLHDPNSVLNFYKRMIQLRKQHDVFVYGTYDLILESHKAIYAYTRTWGNEKAVVIVNLTDRKTIYRYDSLRLNSEQLVLTNYDVKPHKHATRFTLRPYEARVYLVK